MSGLPTLKQVPRMITGEEPGVPSASVDHPITPLTATGA